MHSENISSLNEQVQSLSVASAVQRSNITGIEQALTSQATRLRLTEQSADMQSANISSLRGELHDLSEASANNVVEAKESLASLSSAIESAQSTQTAGDESLVEQLDATSDDVNITKVKVHELEGTISTILSCQQALKFYNATSSACIPPPRDPLRACEQDSDCGNNFICVHREPLAYCQCPIGHSLDDVRKPLFWSIKQISSACLGHLSSMPRSYDHFQSGCSKLRCACCLDVHITDGRLSRPS
eukprot:TRINITY_DN11769_c0_g1_i5.p2 TRINITY_DN11769_c0_g1~~TRINITY_DN11769_c0_g1_i5.p2  ORF type:complete len:265 (+),score=26.29 TRINITY_DN11769_c0_g1_i5:63-797(+)